MSDKQKLLGYKHLSNLTTIAFFVFLFACCSCTQPPEFSFVRQMPEINPEGNFYDFVRGVKCDNSKIVASMISPKIFVYIQDKPKFQSEIFRQISNGLNFFLNNFIFTISLKNIIYFYNKEGKLQSSKAYTEFTGTKVSNKSHDLENNSDTPTIKITWESTGENWHIVSLAINGNDLLKLSK